MLRWRASNHCDDIAYTFVSDGDSGETNLTFGELDQRASAIAALLHELGMRGQRALLLLPSGLEYITAFFGCLYAGVIAIPGFPLHFSRLRRGEAWFHAVMNDAEPCLAFATPEMINRLPREVAGNPKLARLRWLAPEADGRQKDHSWAEPSITPDSLAFLQYTSGSTSMPKGVMISHENLLHNQKVMQHVFRHTRQSVIVSWLPLHHDMGLIANVLQAAYCGSRCVLMAPTTFLRKPVSWLTAITKYRGVTAMAPNFAYELCVRKVTPEDKKDLDLATWSMAINAAEPVRIETLERFATAFADCGFRAGTFQPCYGLAESTVMVTGGRTSVLPLVKHVSGGSQEMDIIREGDNSETKRTLVGCGGTLFGQTVKVVDTVSLTEVDDGVVGEVWISGPSVAQGYWNRPLESKETFNAFLSDGEGPFLRSGDLGFLSEGQLFLAGRLKELIIIRGRNISPEDVESTVQTSHALLQHEPGAAFTVEIDGEDGLVVVNEVERKPDVLLDEVIMAARECVMLEFGVHVHAVVLIRRGTLLKTTSGKIKRIACRTAFQKSEFVVIASRTFPVLQLQPESQGKRLLPEALLQIHPGLRHELVKSYLRDELARILRMDPVKIVAGESLVALGLDSLRALELKGLLESGVGLNLDFGELIRGLSLSDLTTIYLDQLLERDVPIVDENSGASRRNLSKRTEYPVSIGQRGLWLLYQRSRESAAYNLACAGRVKGDLNIAVLRNAFHELMARHEMLRATFAANNDGPFQTFRSPEDLNRDEHFQCHNISAGGPLPVSEFIAAQAWRPFDLEKTPPVRLMVFHLASGEHILLLSVHHIIADFWSFAILLQELGNLYSAGCAGVAPALREVGTNYPDFVQWQATMLEGAAGEQHWNYWSQQLQGKLPVLQIPGDRTRPSDLSGCGSSESMRLDAGVSCSLKALARSHEATVYMVLLAAFQLLLHRLSGQDDVLLGSPASGRTRSEFFDVVGYFTNPLVFRSCYDDTFTFTACLAKVKQSVLEAFKHQDYPFAAIVERLHPERHGGVSPLFQAMLVWQRARSGQPEAFAPLALGEGGLPLQLGNLSFDSIPLPNSSSQFDFTLMMSESQTEIVGTWKYSTDLWDASSVRRMVVQFSFLLAEVALHPENGLSSLSLLTRVEREQLTRQWGLVEPSWCLDDRCVHQLFEEQVLRTPDSLALTVGEKNLTYARLNTQSNQFAHYLRRIGVGPDVRVGLFLNRSVEIIAALLGIWKAGGAYVPLDVRDPKNRLSALIERSGIEVLITHELLLDRLPDQLPQLVLLDLDLDLIEQESETNPDSSPPIESLAYIIYTSGSTGEPKGVMIEHRSVVNLMAGLREAVYDRHQEKPLLVGLNAPITFDSSVKQLLVLAMGHTLCIVLEDVRRSGPALLDYIEQAAIQIMDCTPSQAQLLIDAGLCDLTRPPTFLVGGEPISPGMWQALGNIRETAYYNLYGPTECTVDATTCPIGSVAIPVIGKPLRGTTVYLLDRYMEPAPLGVIGEIFISGNSLARGYLGNPGPTADKFIPDPWCGGSGRRMYRTGDRARALADGNIQFLGRVDRQVKVRGFRIELGEVENALCEYPGVRCAAVVVDSRGHGLIGYVEASEHHASNAYRRFLAQKIPEYMVPSVVVAMQELPTTNNGKKDFVRLPLPKLELELGENYVAPITALEARLVELWSDTLCLKSIGVHDDFFALGGDSLLAARLVARIIESFRVEIPLQTLFYQDPTIAAIAKHLSAPNG